MFTKLEVKKLFGRFDYHIALMPEGVTIITGPNGYGKSTILKCIEAFNLEGDMSFFSSLDFEEIKICFENESDNITLLKNDEKYFLNKKNITDYIKNIRLNPRYLRRISEDQWIDKRTNEIINVDRFYFKNDIYEYYDNITLPDKNRSKEDFIKKLRKRIGKIYYIKEQRLIKEIKDKYSKQEIIDVIKGLPDNLKRHISHISNDYSTTANELDSSYPFRLFSMNEGITEDEYRIRLKEMSDKFEKLNKFDISNMEVSKNVIFKKEHAKALKIYFDDFNQKYKVYEDFINKLDLFTDIVNSRLSFKEIKISRENGLIVIETDNDKKDLNLFQLSSGEKQEIVLFYELIFEVSNNALLLIDEPEISLHISWQKKFMDDLLRIVNYKGIKVIVATHSPQIINNHWDINIDLGALYGDQLNKGRDL